MKKKIYQLAREEFEYTPAVLILQEEAIQKEAQEGGSAKGTLFIRNFDNRRMKGVLYATSPFIHLEATAFSGTEALIDYELRTMDRKAEEHLRGEIYLVTSCGEYRISVELTIKENEQKKKAGNLFRLANLARDDWAAAVEQYKLLYARRSGGGPASQELEEFLIDGSKKWKIQLSTDVSSFYYDEVTESFAESLMIKKDNWGYLKVEVWSDAEFLQPEHKVIWSDSFIGDEYMLEFLVRKEKLHDGKNYGRLYIKTIHQLLTIEVCAVCVSRREEKERRRKQKEVKLWLMNTYFQYRCGLLEKSSYAKEGLRLRRENQNVFPEIIEQYLEIYFMILNNQGALAQELLKDMHPEDRLQKGCEAWLWYLACENMEEKKGYVGRLLGLWEKEPDNMWLLWLLLQVKATLCWDAGKCFEQIEQYNQKHHPSTLLHIELLEALNEKPALLKQLNSSLISALNWGSRMNLLSPEVKERYVFLAANEENCLHALDGLKELYKQEPSEQVLYAINAVMITNNCLGSRYFPWYEKGILMQLRLQGLYEAYLCSADEGFDFRIPKQVLTYFSYDSLLPDSAKELLFSYIIRHKREEENIYLNFLGLIEQFALKRLSEGALNHLLAVIYPEVLKPEIMNDFYLKKLSRFLFREELSCDNPNITGVYVQHKELVSEEYYPLEKGKADIYVFTENARISFVDKDGARYGSSIEYRRENYLDLSSWYEECFRVDDENLHLLLNRYEKIEKYQKFDENANEIRRRVLNIPGLLKEYEAECRLALIHQYFDKMEEELLREQLLLFSPELVEEKERPKLIDYCILQGLNDRAYELIQSWGYQGVPYNRLLRLATRLLETTNGKDEVLLSICSYLLESRRYSQGTLTYLVLFYEGLLGQMARIWEVARENAVETWPLEERILVQLLFTEGYIRNHSKIFASYYRKKKDLSINRAYLNYYSYRYFVKESSLTEEFFSFLPAELDREFSQIMALAFLKEKSGKKELSAKENKRVEELLLYFLQRNRIFPFFKAFKDTNRTYIEYRTAPERRVSLSYRLGDMAEFKVIPMTELSYGIYVADFLLFPDEVLQYYIMEKGTEEEAITESCTLIENDESRELENSSFGLLGAILTARQLAEDGTAEELMEEYILQEYRKEKLFTEL
ncbi:MAG: DUF5717 family protein [Acetivibrio ethanolgignens]